MNNFKIQYQETYINTFYINLTLEYKSLIFDVCVDVAGGIQDIEIKNSLEDWQSLYSECLYLSENEREKFIQIIEDATKEINIKQNIIFQ